MRKSGLHQKNALRLVEYYKYSPLWGIRRRANLHSWLPLSAIEASVLNFNLKKPYGSIDDTKPHSAIDI